MVIKKERVIIAKCEPKHLAIIESTQRDLYGLNFKDISFVDDIYVKQIINMYTVAMSDFTSLEATVLLEGDEVIGYYICDLVLDSVYLAQIYLKEEYRNKGYGKLLLEHFENSVKEVGLSRIELDVSCINEQAVEFYKKHGYDVVETIGDENTKRYAMLKII